MDIAKRIFEIDSDKNFENIALDIFRYQASNCEPYAEYVKLIGVDAQQVDAIEKIPFLPIELYKTHKIYCGSGAEHAELLFSSSGTTNSIQSLHYVKNAKNYEDSFMRAFEVFYDKPSNCQIYALLPGYLEREGSSLIYMIKTLIDSSANGGFYLYDYEKLLADLSKRDRRKKTILFGVSFALLDMAEQYSVDFQDEIIVMETGGMKGRRKELPREELHELLQKSLGVKSIHSEYGMCECLSQSYSSGDGVFYSPKWMKILVRNLYDPFKYERDGVRGGVNIIDLANVESCSFIQTQDIGIVRSEGGFTIEGRIDKSDIRGCNLLVE